MIQGTQSLAPATGFQVGQSASLTRVVSDEMVALMAQVTGDTNPVHLDDAYAATTRFQRRIAHGVFSGGLISAVLGTRLPGPGAIYLSQSLRFTAPVFIGDRLTAQVRVTAWHAEKRRLTLATTCRVGDRITAEGEALLLVP